MTGKARQPASIVMMSSVMPSAKNSCSGSPLKLANGNTAIARRSSNPEGSRPVPARPRRDRRGRPSDLNRRAHAVDADRPPDILQVVRAEILEFVIELVGHMVVGHLGYEDAARLGERLEPGRDIDAVAEDIAVLGDDVAEIDPDPHRKPLLVGHLPIVPAHRVAQSNGAARRLDDAVELDQDEIASVLEDVAVKLGHQRVDHIAQETPAGRRSCPSPRRGTAGSGRLPISPQDDA